MSLLRGRVPWLAAAVAVAVTAGAVAAVLVNGAPNVERLLPKGRVIAARATLSPRDALFGDTVHVRIDVRFDRSRVDARRLRLLTAFDPYAPVEPEITRRRTVGNVTQLIRSADLRCLTSACLEITGGRRRIEFRSADVRYSLRHGGGPRTLEVRFPGLLLSSRLGAREVQIDTLNPQLPQARAETRVLPAPTYAVSPGAASAALVAVAALLLFGAAAFAYPLLPESLRSFGRERPPALPPLERALALLDHARSDGEEHEERKALDLLARELRRRGAGDLAGTARKLAWSRSAPPAEATGDLAHEVRGLLNGRANGRPR